MSGYKKNIPVMPTNLYGSSDNFELATSHVLPVLIRKIIGFEGDLVFDSFKPDGTSQRLIDVSNLKTLDWKSQFDLRDGIKQTY
jgi:hypothetical protein